MENSPMFKLPPGFRFHPTDEELVFQYLRRKVFSCPLPASIVPEIDIGKYNPWDLPGGGFERERYFFALREAKYSNGNRSNRIAGSGYWKATGKDRIVVAPTCNQLVGMKKTLVFHKGKAPKGSRRTDWIMHEYHLAFPRRHNSTNGAIVSASDWVLCRIFMKRRATNIHLDRQEQEERRDIGFIDFMGRRSNPSSPSASNSSCVTEISEDGTSSFP